MNASGEKKTTNRIQFQFETQYNRRIPQIPGRISQVHYRKNKKVLTEQQ